MTALQPHAFALEAAEQWALTKASALSADLFRLSAFWHIDRFVQHLPTDRKTRYTARLAQSENYGIACGLTSVVQEAGQPVSLHEADRSLVGEDCREIIAITDDIGLTWTGRPFSIWLWGTCLPRQMIS